MKTAKIVTAVNWKYAFGEVLLIVVGISIALALNSWWEDRQTRQDERQILSQLAATLDGDIKGFERAIHRFQGMVENISALLVHLEEGRPYDPSLNSKLGSCVGWSAYTPNPGPYEALRSRGFDLISNESLRMSLIDYYETRATRAMSTTEENRIYNRNAAIPYYDKNFIRQSSWGVTPIDFEAIRKDPQFANICSRKRNNMTSWILPNYEAAISEAKALIKNIEQHLNERK